MHVAEVLLKKLDACMHAASSLMLNRVDSMWIC